MNNLEIWQRCLAARDELAEWSGIVNSTFIITGPMSATFLFGRTVDEKNYAVNMQINDDFSVLTQQWTELGDDTVHAQYALNISEGFTAKEFYDHDMVYAVSTDMVIPFCRAVVGDCNIVNYQYDSEADPSPKYTMEEAIQQIVDSIIQSIEEDPVEWDEEDDNKEEDED